jgi:hypothetical protein
MSRQIIHTSELSSPACLMREADEVYLGYASEDELNPLLKRLFEAQSVAAEARGADASEAQWRELLRTHLRARGLASDSPAAGAAVDSRAALAERLRPLLPRVRDDALHADLAGLLRHLERTASGDLNT